MTADAVPPIRSQWRLREHLRVERVRAGLMGHSDYFTLNDVGSMVGMQLTILSVYGDWFEQFIEGVDQDAALMDEEDLYRRGLLDKMVAMNVLETVLRRGDTVIAVLQCYSSGGRYKTVPRPAGVHLSRRCLMQHEGDGLTLFAPDSASKLTIHAADYACALIASVCAATAIAYAADDRFADLLWRYQYLAPIDQGVDQGADLDWEPLDLMFHHRSRFCFDGRFRGRKPGVEKTQPPLPALRPRFDGEAVALPLVDETAIAARSRSCFTVMERRRSSYRAGIAPTPAMIAEFLYRTARLWQLPESDGQERIRRPYPAAGGVHELEFYLAIPHDAIFAAGLYHYDGLGHQLIRFPRKAIGAAKAMLAMAAHVPEDQAAHAILVILTSRYPRLSWRYKNIAYRLALLNAGVVLQSFYLVAADIGLNVHASGSGQSDVFARATGIDPLVETAIAEFVILGHDG